MKTTIELPDALFREAKELASRKGLSLRQVVIEALAQKIRSEKDIASEKPWLKAFKRLKVDPELKQSLEAIRQAVDTEFEQVNLEEWK